MVITKHYETVLLTSWDTETEVSVVHEIIVKTLEDTGINKSPMEGQWTPSQVLQDHLGTIIDSKGAGKGDPRQ